MASDQTRSDQKSVKQMLSSCCFGAFSSATVEVLFTVYSFLHEKIQENWKVQKFIKFVVYLPKKFSEDTTQNLWNFEFSGVPPKTVNSEADSQDMQVQKSNNRKLQKLHKNWMKYPRLFWTFSKIFLLGPHQPVFQLLNLYALPFVYCMKNLKKKPN